MAIDGPDSARAVEIQIKTVLLVDNNKCDDLDVGCDVVRFCWGAGIKKIGQIKARLF